MALPIVAHGARAVTGLRHLVAQLRRVHHLFDIAQPIRPLGEFLSGDGAKLAGVGVTVASACIKESLAGIKPGAGALLRLLLLWGETVGRLVSRSAGAGLLRITLPWLRLLARLGVALILVLRRLLCLTLTGLLGILALRLLTGLLRLLLIRLALPPALSLALLLALIALLVLLSLLLRLLIPWRLIAFRWLSRLLSAALP